MIYVEKEIKRPRRLDDANISNRNTLFSIFGWKIEAWFRNPKSMTATFRREMIGVDEMAWRTVQT